MRSTSRVPHSPKTPVYRRIGGDPPVARTSAQRGGWRHLPRYGHPFHRRQPSCNGTSACVSLSSLEPHRRLRCNHAHRPSTQRRNAAQTGHEHGKFQPTSDRLLPLRPIPSSPGSRSIVGGVSTGLAIAAKHIPYSMSIMPVGSCRLAGWGPYQLDLALVPGAYISKCNWTVPLTVPTCCPRFTV